ncbi:hypothetical protein [Cupriavidus sp. D384]|uniref:hypothetical protein n=1 Tax=Cupriavidus sp. D384 TaxID=1538095 RepID=UPI00083708C7|nr:hypothetical protein [Cupriavidus sp. D384]
MKEAAYGLPLFFAARAARCAGKALPDFRSGYCNDIVELLFFVLMTLGGDQAVRATCVAEEWGYDRDSGGQAGGNPFGYPAPAAAPAPGVRQ